MHAAFLQQNSVLGQFKGFRRFCKAPSAAVSYHHRTSLDEDLGALQHRVKGSEVVPAAPGHTNHAGVLPQHAPTHSAHHHNPNTSSTLATPLGDRLQDWHAAAHFYHPHESGPCCPILHIRDGTDAIDVMQRLRYSMVDGHCAVLCVQDHPDAVMDALGLLVLLAEDMREEGLAKGVVFQPLLDAASKGTVSLLITRIKSPVVAKQYKLGASRAITVPATGHAVEDGRKLADHVIARGSARLHVAPPMGGKGLASAVLALKHARQTVKAHNMGYDILIVPQVKALERDTMRGDYAALCFDVWRKRLPRSTSVNITVPKRRS